MWGGSSLDLTNSGCVRSRLVRRAIPYHTLYDDVDSLNRVANTEAERYNRSISRFRYRQDRTLD